MPRLHMEAQVTQLPLLHAFCEEHGIGDHALLALEEALVNVFSYSGASAIDLSFEDTGEAQVFTIEDDGKAFDPTAYIPCDSNAEMLVAGGQGIRIMRKMMDSLSYRRTGHKNILSLSKLKK